MSRWYVAVGCLLASVLGAAPAIADESVFAVKRVTDTVEVAQFGPRGAFEERNRDITKTAATYWRAWDLGLGLEPRLGGGLFVANGIRSEVDPNFAPVKSDAFGVEALAGLRWNVNLPGPLRAFAEGAVGVAAANKDFPEGGTNWNGVRQWGVGGEWQIDETKGVTLGYRALHMSNGRGIGYDDPSYNGEGWFIGVRRSLGN